MKKLTKTIIYFALTIGLLLILSASAFASERHQSSTEAAEGYALEGHCNVIMSFIKVAIRFEDLDSLKAAYDYARQSQIKGKANEFCKKLKKKNILDWIDSEKTSKKKILQDLQIKLMLAGECEAVFNLYSLGADGEVIRQSLMVRYSSTEVNNLFKKCPTLIKYKDKILNELRV